MQLESLDQLAALEIKDHLVSLVQPEQLVAVSQGGLVQLAQQDLKVQRDSKVNLVRLEWDKLDHKASQDLQDRPDPMEILALWVEQDQLDILDILDQAVHRGHQAQRDSRDNKDRRDQWDQLDTRERLEFPDRRELRDLQDPLEILGHWVTKEYLDQWVQLVAQADLAQLAQQGLMVQSALKVK